MMTLSRYLVALFIISLSVAAYAERSWFPMVSLGVQSMADSERPLPKLDESPEQMIAADVAGLYYSASSQSFVGGVVQGYRQATQVDESSWQALHSWLYSISGIKFFGSVDQPAAFVRGDFGYGQGVVTNADSACIRCVLDSERSEAIEGGFGSLLGVGYGVPFANSSHLMIGLNWSQQTINQQSISRIGVSLGGLF